MDQCVVEFTAGIARDEHCEKDSDLAEVFQTRHAREQKRFVHLKPHPKLDSRSKRHVCLFFSTG